MKKQEYPITSAVRYLREKNVYFEPHLYTYEEHGGTEAASRELAVPEHGVIKTLVLETDQKQTLLMLMHGDCEVSTKNLARFLGVKSVQPCDEKKAERITGYIFGGISPFGTRIPLPVYVERSIFNLSKIFINGGKRGFLVKIDPHDLQILSPTIVEVAILKE